MKKINELVTNTEKPEYRAKRKAITFGSFKRAEERQIQERKDREHQKELALIAEEAKLARDIANEEKRVIKEENTRKRNEFITGSLYNAFGTKTNIDFNPVREEVIDKYLPQLKEPEKEERPTPFKAEPALNLELEEFKKKINEHLHTVGFMGSGGGGIGDIADAGDVDAGTAKVNGKFLKFDSSSGKFVGSDASIGDESIQDVIGAMFSSNTETGITVSYQDADGTIDLVVGTLNQDTTGNAATATALETARNIGGVSFDGTGNINLPGVNTSGSQDTSGNAATATALATARTIGGTSFDGTGNIAVALSAAATALETARTIGGVSFDGTANINLPGVNTAGNQNTSGTAAIATTVTITDNESTNEDNAIIFTAGGDVDGGNLGLESDGTLTYNPSTGKITATGFIGALTGDVTGDVTGNVSGTAATVTGAAQSNITSLGTLTTLTVDNIIINGTNIGHTSDTDSIAIASDGVTTFSQKDVHSVGLSVKNGSSSAGFVEFFENSGNGTNKVTLIGPASTADVTLTLGSTTGTIATTDDIAGEATALAIALG